MAISLFDELYKARIEWPPDQNSWFLPVNTLNSLINYDNVKDELRRLRQPREEQQLSDYTEIICAKAKRVFTVLLYVARIEAIFGLIDDGICDADLPFTRCSKTPNVRFTLCKNSNRCHQRADHRLCGIPTITKWPEHSIGAFCRDQWQVLAPEFNKVDEESIPHYTLDDNVILPFIEDYELQSQKAVRSGYSNVWGVRIHPAHQNLFQIANAPDEAPLLAIKRPFSSDDLDFQRETNMLSALAIRKDPHLIRLLATFKYKGHYHLVFPHATLNLRAYWDRTDVPLWNRETFLWSLNQLSGIAVGLNVIHNFKATVPLGTQPANMTLQVPSGQLKVARFEEKFGRHGDIKPENILWLENLEGVPEEGILQIADMGLGRFHRLDSRSQVDAKSISGSPTYMPPEIALDLPVSRAYDIWSLGCVFLEFITWLLEGGTSVYQFSSFRGLTVPNGYNSVINDDTYFTKSTDKYGVKYAEVRQGVKDWIVRLRQNKRCSQMIHCLLNIVQNQMLVVDSKKRIDAEHLVMELRGHLDQAENDIVYLLGPNRPIVGQTTGMKKPRQNIPLSSQEDNYSDYEPKRISNSQSLTASPTILNSLSLIVQDYSNQ